MNQSVTNKEKSIERILIAFIIISIVIIIIFAILGLSFARYEDETIAYAGFGASSFNGALLGDIDVEELIAFTAEDEEALTEEDLTEEDFSSIEFGYTVTDISYYPGMEYDANDSANSAEIFPFTVANGTTPDNASEVDLEYTIRLRTTQNMPFEYTLTVETENEDGTTGITTYETIGPYKVDDEFEIGYEYIFIEEGDADDITGVDEMDMDDVLALVDEAQFFLANGGADTQGLSLNAHTLIVEWPIIQATGDEIATNSSEYMKEIELVQILATVTSANKTDDDYSNYTVESSLFYGTGIIILDPDGENFLDILNKSDTDSYEQTYSYDIDYRGFSSDGTYELLIDNGIDRGIENYEQIGESVSYEMNILMPYKNDIFPDFTVDVDGDDEDDLGDVISYRLYNLVEGTYEELLTSEVDEKCGEYQDSLKYEVYSVYSVVSDGELDSIETDCDTVIFQLESGANMSDEDAFSNKIKVEVIAKFTN